MVVISNMLSQGLPIVGKMMGNEYAARNSNAAAVSGQLAIVSHLARLVSVRGGCKSGGGVTILFLSEPYVGCSIV